MPASKRLTITQFLHLPLLLFCVRTPAFHMSAALAPPAEAAVRALKHAVLQQVMSPNSLVVRAPVIDKLLSSVKALQGQNDWTDWKLYMEMLLDTEGLLEPYVELAK